MLKVQIEGLVLRPPNEAFISLPGMFDFNVDEQYFRGDDAQGVDKIIVLPNGKKIRITIGPAMGGLLKSINESGFLEDGSDGDNQRSQYWTVMEYCDSSRGDSIQVEQSDPSFIKWEVGGCIKVSGGS